MPTEKNGGGIKVSFYEIFIMACKIAGVIIMLPAVLGCVLCLLCWVCCLLVYIIVLPFWIIDKFSPSVSTKYISSRRKPEQPPPPPKVTEFLSKEESNVETEDTEP